MKKIFFVLVAAALLAASCDEFPPSNYDNVGYDAAKVYTDADFPGVTFTTIAELKAMYSNSAVDLGSGIVLKAQVTSSDKEGNLYRTMYIQDETGGIELKMGTRNLYNEYKIGQWIYVDCNGLTIGAYRNMLQLGYASATGSSYETAYLDIQYIIDTHIFKGAQGTPLEPKVLTAASELTADENIGRYVTVQGLTYGSKIFVLIYDNSNNSTYKNISGAYDFNRWALNEVGYARYMSEDYNYFFGNFTASEVANDYDSQSCSVSQYFKLGSTDLQVRTSGYARFADEEIPDEIYSGGKSCNLTGILTKYNSYAQFILIDLDGVEVCE